mgnify:CR=1 FL=1
MKNSHLESEIQTAMNLSGWAKFIKVALAILVVLSYFFFKDWLIEIIVIAVVVALIFPLGFFDVFIQKLLEYNTQTIEERQILNANEANNHFEKIYKKIGE